METKIEIDRASRAKMEKAIEKFVRVVGKTAEEGITQIAKSAGRQLVHTVQPFGITSAKGEKFHKSIAKQVNRAVRNANIEGVAGGAASVHHQRRDSRGQVPRELPTEGRFKRDPIAVGDKEAHIRKAQAKAGRAKGAWVEASDSLGGTKLSNIPKWISSNNNGGYGSSSKSGEGLKFKCELKNETPYLTRIQTQKSIAQSVVHGLKKGLKRMHILTARAEEKANYELQ
jgi:hypothetical protein